MKNSQTTQDAATTEVQTTTPVAKKTRSKKAQPKENVEVQTTENDEVQTVENKKERAPKKSKFDSVQEALCEQNGISELTFMKFISKKFQGKKATQNKIAEILIERNLFDKDKLIAEIKG